MEIPSIPTSSSPIRAATAELLNTPNTALEVRSRKSHRMSCAYAVLHGTACKNGIVLAKPQQRRAGELRMRVQVKKRQRNALRPRALGKQAALYALYTPWDAPTILYLK
jgi:hypothetical protein